MGLGVCRGGGEGWMGLTSDLWRREDDVLLELLALEHVLLALDDLLNGISVRGRTCRKDLIRGDVHWRGKNQRHSEREERKGREGGRGEVAGWWFGAKEEPRTKSKKRVTKSASAFGTPIRKPRPSLLLLFLSSPTSMLPTLTRLGGIVWCVLYSLSVPCDPQQG